MRFWWWTIVEIAIGGLCVGVRCRDIECKGSDKVFRHNQSTSDKVFQHNQSTSDVGVRDWVLNGWLMVCGQG